MMKNDLMERAEEVAHDISNMCRVSCADSDSIVQSRWENTNEKIDGINRDFCSLLAKVTKTCKDSVSCDSEELQEDLSSLTGVIQIFIENELNDQVNDLWLRIANLISPQEVSR